MKIRAGTGISRAQDAQTAGREAAAAAVAQLSGESPALIVVYACPKYDLPALLRAVRTESGNTPLIGATTSGEFARGEHLGFGAGVAVLALTAGPYRYGVASASHIAADLDGAGAEIARAARAAAGPATHGAVVLLADALLGDLQQLVRGIYRVTGPKVPTVGGAAGDELKFRQTLVFHDDRVVEQGAVALWIASDHKLPVVTRHGWEPIGVPMLITRAQGTEVIEIAGRPAALAYEEQLGIAPGQLSAEKFWDTSLYHPLGLLQPDGSMLIRAARTKTPQNTLKTQGALPPAGGAVQVMQGSADSLLGIVGEVADTALAALPDAGVLLAFSCAARATIFGGRTPEEPRSLQAAAGDVPTFGIYCCGEFARTDSVIGTHNVTLTAIAL